MKKILLFALSGALMLGAMSSCKKDDNNFNVRFDSRGGSAVMSEVVPDGGKVKMPTNPTKTGFVFDEWTRDVNGNTPWNFSTDVVRSSITLYAQWTTPAGPVFETLQQMMEDAGDLNQPDYTSGSWAALQTQLTASAGLTASSPEATIQAAIDNLQAAMDGLVNIADLNTAIQTGSAQQESNFTTASWAPFKEKLDAAIAVQGQANATQAQVDQAVADLQAAYDALVPDSDRAALQAKVDEFNARTDQADYTPATWQALQDKVTAAQTLLDATDPLATDAQMEQALADINTAQTALVTDKDLVAKIAEVNALDQADYTPDSWQNLQDKKTAAQSAIDATNPASTQAQIDQALSDLQAAQDALVDVTALNATIAVEGQLDQNNYTSASWADVQTALTNANALLQQGSNATQQQIDDANTQLTTAIQNLQIATPTTDKSNLQASISTAGTKTEANYTAASWSDMQTALDAANTVNNDTTATQAQVDAATAELNRAIAALQDNVVTDSSADKTALDAFIADSQKLNQADYTADSWTVFSDALTAAQTTSADTAATQTDVDQAYTNLENAVNDLVPSTGTTGVVSGLVNQLTSLLNSLPTATAISGSPLLQAAVTPVATLADTVRDQLMNIVGNNTGDQTIIDLNTQLNSILTAAGLGGLI